MAAQGSPNVDLLAFNGKLHQIGDPGLRGRTFGRHVLFRKVLRSRSRRKIVAPFQQVNSRPKASSAAPTALSVDLKIPTIIISIQ